MGARRTAAALHPEDALAVLAGAAADIDAVAYRTARALRRLESGQAAPHLSRATRAAAEALGEVAMALRRDGLLNVSAKHAPK